MGMGILTLAHIARSTAETATRPSLLEQGFEKVTEVAVANSTGTGKASVSGTTELKAFVPSRGWPEFLSLLPVGAQLIECGSFLRVFQDGVGLANFLEALFAFRIVGDIWMILAGQLAIRTLDLILRRVPAYAHGCVVVVVVHSGCLRHCISRA